MSTETTPADSCPRPGGCYTPVTCRDAGVCVVQRSTSHATAGDILKRLRYYAAHMPAPLSETDLPAWMALLERYRNPGAKICLLKQVWGDVQAAYAGRQLELDLIDNAGVKRLEGADLA